MHVRIGGGRPVTVISTPTSLITIQSDGALILFREIINITTDATIKASPPNPINIIVCLVWRACLNANSVTPFPSSYSLISSRSLGVPLARKASANNLSCSAA